MKASRKQRHVAVHVGTPVAVVGVAYFDLVGAEGLRFFRCGSHEMTLSMTGCGARWRAAQMASGDGEASACRSCPIGAAHAGGTHVRYSRLYHAAICPRCRFGATRIIGGRICVNCYNREREVIAGRNARGNVPTMLLATRPMRAVGVTVTVDGVVRRVVFDGVVDLLEPMIQTLRTTTGDIRFSRTPKGLPTAQRDLFGGYGGAWTVQRRTRAAPRRPAHSQGEFWPANDDGLAVAA